MERKTHSYQPFIISVLMHICLILLLSLTPSKDLFPPQQQNVEILYQNETDKKRQVVMSPENRLKEALKDLKEKAKRLSQYTQRVNEEVIARNSGPTKNAAPSFTAPPVPAHPSSEGKEGSLVDRAVARDTRLGYSGLSDYIPDVRQGGFTALNTDQFVYYTFYARINDQLRNRWVQLVRDFLNATPQIEINRLAQKTQVTQIEVLLTPDGRYVKSILYMKADSPTLDQIADMAFRQATPFNNPPSEMVEKDGYVHLHYALYLQLLPHYVANGSK